MDAADRRTRRGIGWRWPSTRPPTRRWRRGWRGRAWRTDDELIVLHVSAGNPFRRWPEASFAETAAALASGSPRRRLVFSSGPSDREAAARIAADARGRLGAAADRIVDLGEFDLQELRALVGRSRLFVGGDTGPLHIAATTDTPVVGIYGPTLPARSAPWRPPLDRDVFDRDGSRGSALPAVRPAGLRAGRFPVSDRRS